MAAQRGGLVVAGLGDGLACTAMGWNAGGTDGLWHVVATPEEHDVFDALGLSYVAPEVRW